MTERSYKRNIKGFKKIKMNFNFYKLGKFCLINKMI